MAGIGQTALEENWWGDISYNAFTMRDWRNTCDTGYSGGPPMDFGYTEPKPVPVERCESVSYTHLTLPTILLV